MILRFEFSVFLDPVIIGTRRDLRDRNDSLSFYSIKKFGDTLTQIKNLYRYGLDLDLRMEKNYQIFYTVLNPDILGLLYRPS